MILGVSNTELEHAVQQSDPALIPPVQIRQHQNPNTMCEVPHPEMYETLPLLRGIGPTPYHMAKGLALKRYAGQSYHDDRTA
jgi:hypothetical protein